MSYSLNNKRFNSNYHEYLLGCDLTNKYCLLNTYNRPKIKEIVVSLPMKNFQNSNISSYNKQARSFFFFQIIFFLFPFISLKSFQTEKYSNQKKLDFSLKIILSNSEQINSFLVYLFVENFDALKKKIFF